MNLKLIGLLKIVIFAGFVFADSKQNVFLGFSQSQYVTPTSFSNQSDSYSQLSLNYGYLKKTSSWTSKAEVLSSIYTNTSDGLYLAAPEFYTQYKHKDSKISLGRMKHQWSYMESEWKLDLWQPQVKWDLLNPVNQGLTGIYVQGNLRPWKYTLLYSPLFLPEQGPQFKVQNGNISSNSRWFQPPVSEVELKYGRSNVFYELEMPNPLDVVNHAGYAIQLENGEEDRGLKLSLAYTYKPRNQLHLGIQTQGIQKLQTGQLRPVLVPVVVYHHMTSVETQMSFDDTKIIASANSEVPVDPKLPEDWEETELNSNYSVSLNLETRLNFDRKSLFKVGYMKYDEFENPVSKTKVVDGDFASPTQRFLFSKAVRFGWERSWMKGNIKTEFDYVYSINEDGGLLSSVLKYEPHRPLSWYVRLDVIGAGKELEKDTFISTYQTNDRLEAGVRYVF